MKKTIDCIFVYGTLRKNGALPIAELLENRVEFLGEASISGKIYLVDYYPGLVVNDPGLNLVHGEVYKLIDFQDLSILDEYEGVSNIPSPKDLFKKVIVIANLRPGIAIKCLAYTYNHLITKKMKWIISGDYIQDLS
jgi:gamma-glutamylcyclotransferase (GGCT)/AIG2-like uncharacterized protein YtfP